MFRKREVVSQTALFSEYLLKLEENVPMRKMFKLEDLDCAELRCENGECSQGN